jgi:hypothetical protein
MPQQSPDGPAAKLYQEVQDANAVLLGKPGVPVFNAFLDPNCPHCQHFLRDTEQAVLAGKIAIRVIPVAFEDKSRKQAAFVLAAGDGAIRLLAYAKGDASALPVPDGFATEGVENNTKILGKWDLLATPIIVYKTPKGDIKLIRGRPLDPKAAIADLTGNAP